jgi:hypothetical protein
MLILVAVVAVIYTATILISGEPTWLIPGAILLVLILGSGVLQNRLAAKQLDRHGGDKLAAQRDDDDWAIPSAHLNVDDDTAAGDTPEVHNEISPHDLPKDHPGRAAAEAQAGDHDDAGGTTTGNDQGGAGGRFERGDDQTAERTGERQRSATAAKSAGTSGETPGQVEGDEPKYFPN